jgi:hypothetical protein
MFSDDSWRIIQVGCQCANGAMTATTEWIQVGEHECFLHMCPQKKGRSI